MCCDGSVGLCTGCEWFDGVLRRPVRYLSHLSDDTIQPLLMLPRPKPTQATTWHSCTGQAGFQITLAYPELTKLQTRQACAGLRHTNLILDFITGQAWMTFKHHCFQMPPVVTDYRGEINLTAYGINNPDTNNLPGPRADHGL